MIAFRNKNALSLKHHLMLSLALAFVYCIFFNSALLLYKFEYYKADIFLGSLNIIKDFLYIFLANFIAFYGLSSHKILLIPSALVLFVTGATSSYASFFFKAKPTQNIIRTIFENNISESLELLSTRASIWLIFCIISCFYILLKFRIFKFRIITRPSAILCLVIFIFSVFSPRYQILREYFPFQYLHNLYLYISDASKKHSKLDISETFQFTSKNDEIIGILVIGESLRYDHLQINGYQRNTTPFISNTPNIFSFKAIAAGSLTYITVPYMLSRLPKSMADKAIYESTLLSVLTKLQFNTAWIGTQTILRYLRGRGINNTLYDEVDITIIPGGSALYKMNAHDGVMLPYIQNFIDTFDTKKKFLVVHMSGSHWNYDQRYPREYKKFEPTCPSAIKIDYSECKTQQLTNSYDNTIVYTDYILSSIIEYLKNKNAFLLFVSDHGESLGENGVYGHGGNMIKEQIEIPLIFWGSDIFFSKNQGVMVNLINSSNKIFGHENIFHSILDCSGVESEIVDKSLSLCRGDSHEK